MGSKRGKRRTSKWPEKLVPGKRGKNSLDYDSTRPKRGKEASCFQRKKMLPNTKITSVLTNKSIFHLPLLLGGEELPLKHIA